MDTNSIRREIKFNAKRRLFSYLIPCIGVALVGSVITTLFSMILTMQMPDVETLLQAEDLTVYWPMVGKIQGLSLAFSLLISPLTMGSYAFFMEVSADKRPAFTSVFAWLGEGKRLAAAYKANLWYLVIALKYMVIYCLPGGLALGLVLWRMETLSVGLSLGLYLLAMLAFFSGVIIAFARVNAYLPAMYMVAADPTLAVRKTFDFCGQVMKPHVWEFFWFRLSFLGWEILAALTFGFSVLFVTPYENLAFAGWTRYIKALAFQALSREGERL